MLTTKVTAIKRDINFLITSSFCNLYYIVAFRIVAYYFIVLSQMLRDKSRHELIGSLNPRMKTFFSDSITNPASVWQYYILVGLLILPAH
jgi:hypothetical protein